MQRQSASRRQPRASAMSATKYTYTEGVDTLDLEEQPAGGLPGTPKTGQTSAAAGGGTPSSVRGRMLSGVMKTVKTNPGDLMQLTRQLAFKKKLEDQLALESLNAQVQKLKQDAEIDDLAKYKKSGKPNMIASAAKAFLKSSTNASWIPTLVATKGRPWPGMPVLLTIAIAVAVTCVELLYLKDTRKFPKVVCAADEDKMCSPYTLAIPSSTVGVIGSALFFLMVFRTNASYDRWWEGRKKWGMIINRTRDFSRQVSGFVKSATLDDRCCPPHTRTNMPTTCQQNASSPQTAG